MRARRRQPEAGAREPAHPRIEAAPGPQPPRQRRRRRIAQQPAQRREVRRPHEQRRASRGPRATRAARPAAARRPVRRPGIRGRVRRPARSRAPARARRCRRTVVAAPRESRHDDRDAAIACDRRGAPPPSERRPRSRRPASRQSTRPALPRRPPAASDATRRTSMPPPPSARPAPPAAASGRSNPTISSPGSRRDARAPATEPAAPSTQPQSASALRYWPAPARKGFRLRRIAAAERVDRDADSRAGAATTGTPPAPRPTATPASCAPGRRGRCAPTAAGRRVAGSQRPSSRAGLAVEREHALDQLVPGDDVRRRPDLEPTREAVVRRGARAGDARGGRVGVTRVRGADRITRAMSASARRCQLRRASVDHPQRRVGPRGRLVAGRVVAEQFLDAAETLRRALRARAGW